MLSGDRKFMIDTGNCKSDWHRDNVPIISINVENFAPIISLTLIQFNNASIVATVDATYGIVINVDTDPSD